MRLAIASGVLGVLGLLGAASCAHEETSPLQKAAPPALKATGTFKAKEGTSVSGTVDAVEEGGAVRLRIDVRGAPPGVHGIHIHEKGDCSAPDFSSAGGHFNPTGAPHSCPPKVPRHAGDLGNIEIGADGSGHLEVVADGITIAPGPTSIAGKAMILHHGKDDCSSQPAGDSGMRVGCAVLNASQ